MIKSFAHFNESLLASQYRPYMKHFDRERYAQIFKSHKGGHDKNFYRIYIPIIKSKSETQSQIEILLNRNGYEVIDYMAGRAKFKNAKNVTRIGQVLQRISRNAESKIDVNSAIELSKKFVEDSNRKAGNDLMVCISRHPYDIAGSDTDRNWSNCLTMARPDTKRYRDYITNLKKEISKVDLRKLGSQIDTMLQDNEEIDIEKVDLDLFVGIEKFKKSIVDELESNDIHIDADLYVRYEDEDGLVDTDNDEVNELVDKYNYIVDMIQDIDKFIYHGSNVSYIETHVKAGVLLTYLIRENDRNINDPIANLDIKPYFNIFDPSDIFLYPDTRMYGHGTSDYRNTVMNWVKGVNKGKMGIYRLMDGIYNDNLQNKTLLVCENGYVIDENNKPGSRGYETDKRTLKLYSDIMKDIKSDEEAEIYIQYVLKNIGNMSICGDLQSDILFKTPEKWEQYYKKTRKRFYGWL